jgi:trimethylamine--corrinoid protein Co-methyltransferase
MDPRTGGYIGNTYIPFTSITVQLAHAWNVPCLGGGSTSSDASDIGWESGTDGGFGAALVPLAGGEVCGYLGMLGSSMILYPEQLIMEHETCQYVYDYFASYAVSKSDLDMDVIKKVGPRGHYLREKHTRVHMRDFYYSPLLRKVDASGNPRPPREMALEEFNKILANHKPAPLPGDVQAELDRVIAAADREAEKLRA